MWFVGRSGLDVVMIAIVLSREGRIRCEYASPDIGQLWNLNSQSCHEYMADSGEARWSTLGKTIAHEGRVTLVDHEVLLPDSSRTNYVVDESAPFSVAALVLDGNDVLLTRQYRYPPDRWIFDLPGGRGRADESPSMLRDVNSKKSSASSPTTSDRSIRFL